MADDGAITRKRPRSDARRLRIVHFNDVYNVQVQSGHVCGGASRFVSLLHSFRPGGANYDAMAGDPLVLFSGDAFNPSVMSTITRGKQMPPVLNNMGIAAACYGNHDFDFGIDGLIRLKNACNFPWLISNVTDALDAEGGPLADGRTTVVIEAGADSRAVRVGVMGLVEREWLATLATLDEDDVVYEDFVDCARRLSRQLREEEHVDLVVALTHMRMPNDVRLAREAGDVVDLILGGHDHHYECKFVDPHGVLLCKSGTDFRELTVVDLNLDERAPTPSAVKVAALGPAASAYPLLVPADFAVPSRHTTADFLFRMLSVADLEPDFNAVMSSVEPLRHVFAAHDDWPWPEMTRDDDVKDLRRHQREFELRLAFAYTVFDPTNKVCLGCFYINPATKDGFDAEIIFWIRQDCAQLAAAGCTQHAELERRLGQEIRAWLAVAWPCLSPERICWPGRFDHDWAAMDALSWRDTEVLRVAHDATTVVRYNARASGLALAAPAPGGYTLPDAAVATAPQRQEPSSAVTAANTSESASGATVDVAADCGTSTAARGFEVLCHKRWEVTRDLVEHAATAAIVAQFEKEVLSNMEKVVGVTAVDLECRFNRIRAMETNIANFVADTARHACSMALATKGDMAVDIVLLNSGALRADKVIPAGSVRVGDLMALLPMCDTMVVLVLTAEQVLECLENSVSQWPRLEGRWPCVSGIAFEFNGEAPSGSRVVRESVTVARKPLEFAGDSGAPARTYTLATRGYLAKGKDGYNCLADCPVLVDEEVLPPLPTMLRQHFKAIDIANNFVKPAPATKSSPRDGMRRTASSEQISQRWAGRVERHFSMTKCDSPRSAGHKKDSLALGIHPVVDGRIRIRQQGDQEHAAGQAGAAASPAPKFGATLQRQRSNSEISDLSVHIPDSPLRRAGRAPSFDGANLDI